MRMEGNVYHLYNLLWIFPSRASHYNADALLRITEMIAFYTFPNWSLGMRTEGNVYHLLHTFPNRSASGGLGMRLDKIFRSTLDP